MTTTMKEPTEFSHKDYAIGCGGTETWIKYEGRHYLYVWHKFEKRHEYYCHEDDRFMADDDAPWMKLVTRYVWRVTWTGVGVNGTRASDGGPYREEMNCIVAMNRAIDQLQKDHRQIETATHWPIQRDRNLQCREDV